MGDVGNNADAKLTLYTNHLCPWAHRAHILVKELGLDYEEVIIDLDTPRPDWYLKINPRGLVPALVYSDPSLKEPITILESGLVVQFLIDAFPTLSRKVLPPSTSAEAAHLRYRINFFVDTWSSKANSFWMKILLADDAAEAESYIDQLVKTVEEHIEPLLHDAGPFFGGSHSITLAEVLTASFILRIIELSGGNAISSSLKERLYALPNFSKWAKNTLAQESVTYIWNTDEALRLHAEKIPKLRARYKQPAAK